MSFLDVNGVSIRYELRGKENGPLLVLLHEIGGTIETFDLVAQDLLPRYRLLAFDQRGSGFSEKVRTPFGIDDLVGDLYELVEAIVPGSVCNFVTVAAAGLQALRFYQMHMEQVGSIIMCNPALGVDPSRSSVLLERAEFAEKHGIRAGLETTLDKSYQPELRDSKVFPEVRGRYLSNDPYGFAEANRVLATTDLRAILPEVVCPVMVVAGRQDQVRPFKGSQEVADRVPGARFELLEGGHFLPINSPGALSSVITDFLDSIG